jgi:hypothetical protein
MACDAARFDSPVGIVGVKLRFVFYISKKAWRQTPAPLPGRILAGRKRGKKWYRCHH